WGRVVTPHASFLSLAFAPEESLANLAALAGRFPAYGHLGFYDSVNVGTGQVAQTVLALDQGMILAAIANALDDRVMQRYFSTGLVEASIRPLMAPERFSAGGEISMPPPGGVPPTLLALPEPPQAVSNSAGH
ncbi:MAG: hypothetical protein LC745_12350, partial [Planctomycetia bacterium]|nr:hypothetical protein [Planctomycetia bacterium]